jgi:hypothetical protein
MPANTSNQVYEYLFFVCANPWQRKRRAGFGIYGHTLTVSYPALVVIGSVKISCTRKMVRRVDEFTSLIPVNPWYEIIGKGKLDLTNHPIHCVNIGNSPEGAERRVSLGLNGIVCSVELSMGVLLACRCTFSPKVFLTLSSGVSRSV